VLTEASDGKGMPYSRAAASAADDAPKSSSFPSRAIGLSPAPGNADEGEVLSAAGGGGGAGAVEDGGAPVDGVSPPAGLRLRLFFAASY